MPPQARWLRCCPATLWPRRPERRRTPQLAGGWRSDITSCAWNSGETVIAGQAEPHSTVEIVDAGTVIASGNAGETGDWAIALEEPLPPGTHDLAIQTTSPDESVVMLSDQRVTVSVPEDGADVLVVLNAPGAPSTVLQVPEGADVAGAAPATVEPDASAPGAVAAATGEDSATTEPAAPGEVTIAAAPERRCRRTQPRMPAGRLERDHRPQNRHG